MTAPETSVPAFPSARRSSRGYDEGDVDAFVTRLSAALDGVPGAAPVTARQVRGALFRRVPVGRRGYDADAVDGYLHRAATVLAAREEAGGDPVDPAEVRRVLAGFRPRRTRLGRGYLPEEVDAFLAGLDRALAEGTTVAPTVAAEASFRVVVGGYAVDDVDDLLDRLEGALLSGTRRAP